MQNDLTSIDIKQVSEEIERESQVIYRLSNEINKKVIGQEKMVESLLIGLLANGHVLLEGVPGLAKTLAIKTLSEAVNGSFSRIQFTPDLLPADVVGTLIYNIKENDFKIKKGPIFTNFVLADEINRSPAKVQSALLEAMQEKQVTIGDETYKLENPFLVLATQNPVEQEGTYPLPEAQVDRFMLKTVITYPNREAERLVLRNSIDESFPKVEKVIDLQEILRAREMVKKVYMDEKIERYILDIISATRKPSDFGLSRLSPLISFGASPRGSINLALSARVFAFLRRRAYVIPEDVRAMSKDVLRHRIGLSYEAEAENINADFIIDEILNAIPIP
ncbi:AAA family ATPase [Moheibacter lacus]|uniref:MoxR family ATPase n=1 Tax=Moheibacter lacus TaxID=2745851 RepID=A0A838ZIC5_9FLAO|nr:MoxR family ATPase [Moheibacter lacus]MBA5628998.1 MoxR family ATPase [Moheibacter lacus]